MWGRHVVPRQMERDTGAIRPGLRYYDPRTVSPHAPFLATKERRAPAPVRGTFQAHTRRVLGVSEVDDRWRKEYDGHALYVATVHSGSRHPDLFRASTSPRSIVQDSGLRTRCAFDAPRPKDHSNPTVSWLFLKALVYTSSAHVNRKVRGGYIK